MNQAMTMQRLRAVLFEKQHRLVGDSRDRRGINHAFERNGTADDADTAAAQTDLEINCRLCERHGDELAEIETAIRKMHRDEYGLCEECGGAISKKRLSVLPHAKFCLRCQEAHERRSERESDAARWEDVMSWDEAEDAPEGYGVRAYRPDG